MSLIRTFEAQVVWCGIDWLNMFFRGDSRGVQVRYGFDSVASAHGTLEDDLTLNLEYKQKVLFDYPVQKEILDALERYDNVVVEEHKVGFIRKNIVHKIILVQRGEEILYSKKKWNRNEKSYRT